MHHHGLHIVPVLYEGGPLDGVINDQDYDLENMKEGQVWDYPTRMTYDTYPVGVQDTVERYVLACRGGDHGWVWIHTGTFEQPIDRQAFNAAVFGGPQDGEVRYLLGTARDRVGPGYVGHLVPGYELHHIGDDPSEGWELRWVG